MNKEKEQELKLKEPEIVEASRKETISKPIKDTRDYSLVDEIERYEREMESERNRGRRTLNTEEERQQRLKEARKELEKQKKELENDGESSPFANIDMSKF